MITVQAVIIVTAQTVHACLTQLRRAAAILNVQNHITATRITAQEEILLARQ